MRSFGCPTSGLKIVTPSITLLSFMTVKSISDLPRTKLKKTFS